VLTFPIVHTIYWPEIDPIRYGGSLRRKIGLLANVEKKKGKNRGKQRRGEENGTKRKGRREKTGARYRDTQLIYSLVEEFKFPS